MEIEIDLSEVPSDKLEQVENAIDDLFIEWSMNDGIPSDAEDQMFELISDIIY